jgi:hypothetical protein
VGGASRCRSRYSMVKRFKKTSLIALMLAATFLFTLLPPTAAANAAAAESGNFVLDNRSPRVLRNLYIAPFYGSWTGPWSNDLFGADVLYPGQMTTVYVNPYYYGTCEYNLEFVSAGGLVTTMWDVDLCSTSVINYR